LINGYLAAQNLNFGNFDLIMELGSPESIKSAVAAGLGVSILSVATLEKERKLNLLAQRGLDPPITRPFTIIYQRQKRRVKAMEEFLRFNQSDGRWQQEQT
jgi:DNA-binding transcriptional LysR family regulator